MVLSYNYDFEFKNINYRRVYLKYLTSVFLMKDKFQFKEKTNVYLQGEFNFFFLSGVESKILQMHLRNSLLFVLKQKYTQNQGLLLKISNFRMRPYFLITFHTHLSFSTLTRIQQFHGNSNQKIPHFLLSKIPGVDSPVKSTLINSHQLSLSL